MIRAELPVDPALLPPLPVAFESALDAGLASLGLRLAPEARRAIDGHVRLLLAWNAAINLTAITEPGAIATRHVLDSLAALPLVPPTPGLRIADVGSGGGFPGMTLAAALPGSRVTLVDSVAKKARFLEVVVTATGLGDRVTVRAARAEAVAAREPVGWDVVTARAVAGLPDLVELALPLLRVGGRLLAWKGPDIDAELAAAGRAASALGAADPEVHDITADVAGLAGHRIVVVRKRGATPPGYPRDPARRKHLPW